MLCKMGSAKIVKSWRFKPISPETCEAPAILHRRRGYNIRRYTHIQPGTKIAVIVQKGTSTSRQIWWEAGFFDRSKGI